MAGHKNQPAANPDRLSAYMKLDAVAELFGLGKSSIQTLIKKYGIDFVPHFGKFGSVRRADMELLWDKLAKCHKWNANPKLKKLKASHQWQPGPPPARLENLPHYRAAGLYRLIKIPKEKLVGPGLEKIKVGMRVLYELDNKTILCFVTQLHHHGVDVASCDHQENGHYPLIIFKNIPAGFLQTDDRLREWGSDVSVGSTMLYRTKRLEVFPCVVIEVKDQSASATLLGNREFGKYPELHPSRLLRNIPVDTLMNRV
jgi:hypothetical protein